MLSPEFVVPRANAEPLTTVRHGGIELPLYDASDVTWDSQELKRASQMGRANVVRSVRINRNLRFVLAELLDITERTFSEVAATTNTTVIPHSWGFSVAPDSVHQNDSSHFLSYFSPDLPGNTVLVAQVAIIPRAQTVYDRFHELDAALNKHLSGKYSQYVWFDAEPRNFVQDEQGEVYLTDIEPFIMRSEDRRQPAGLVRHITDSTIK